MPQYQLVIQLPASTLADFDRLVALESSVASEIGNVGVVDGHDMGAGECNIFVHTDSPAEVFDKIRRLLEDRGLLHVARAAYRRFSSDEYTVLHPNSCSDFRVI